MVNTSTIDVRAFYEQYLTLAGKPSNAWRTGEREYHGNCPWCGGVDRFAFWSSGRYSCSIRASGCGRAGRDVLDFLREYEGLNFIEACNVLGIEPVSEYHRLARGSAPASDEPPCQKWQERAGAVLHLAERLLWSGRGEGALAYLRGRGLTDETIRTARLGYIPLTHQGRWYRDTSKLWGLASEDERNGEDVGVWLPEGIVIPWFADGQLWKLNVRRLRGVRDGDAKYVQVRGSREGLYNVDALRVERPVILCESEFDALAGEQACGDLAAFAATGATTRARRDRWLARIGLASHVLVAYDDDPPDRNRKRAGDEGAAYWVKALPHALQWLPWAHDVNEMLQRGQDLRAWATLGVHVALTEAAQAKAVSPPCISGMVQAAGEPRAGEYEHQQTQQPEEPCSPAQRMVCSLSTLPPLPQTQCPFRVVAVGHDQHIGATKCPGRVRSNGWCETHQGAQHLLDLGALLDYPRLELTPHRAIGAGKGSWEAYASYAPARWLEHDLSSMKALVERGCSSPRHSKRLSHTT
jgi:DNA primase